MSSSATASILGFVAVAALLVLTPGVGTTYLLATVMERGRRAAHLTAVGMICGAAVHATIAVAGAAVLLRTVPESLTWIALIGGGLIVFIGARGLVRAWTATPREESVSEPPQPHGLILTGFLISLSNAPLPLFYFVVVPQYVPRGMSRAGGAALLSAIHLSMAFGWMLTFTTLVGRVLDFLRQPRVRFGLQCATGLILIGLGLRAMATAI
jgi:threonine/homoserine/homoserine lactone efflux protein